MDVILQKIAAHPNMNGYVNLYYYKGGMEWQCSVSWDDNRKRSICGAGETPTDAAERALAMLNGEIEKAWR